MRSLKNQSGYLGVGGKRVIGGSGSNTAIDALIRSLAPAAWFRQGVGITVTGSGVSQWDDLSGNGRHLLQATDAARPALQADGTILFNGTSHYLKTNAFTLNQPTCVLWVGKQVSWTLDDWLFDGDATNSGAAYQSATTPRITLRTGATVTTENANLAVNTLGVLSAVFNSTSSSSRVNNTTAVIGNAGSGNMGGLTLGAAGGGTNFANISTSELIVFPFAPSTALEARLIAGLMARHGVSL